MEENTIPPAPVRVNKMAIQPEGKLLFRSPVTGIGQKDQLVVTQIFKFIHKYHITLNKADYSTFFKKCQEKQRPF